jgi:Ca2+-binding EF-hand superfamily protein
MSHPDEDFGPDHRLIVEDSGNCCERRCCRVVPPKAEDWMSTLVVALGIVGAIAYAILLEWLQFALVLLLSVALGVAAGRVRHLRVARQLSESVDFFQEENRHLKEQVERLSSDLALLDQAVGIVRDAGLDFEAAHDKIMGVAAEYKEQNDRLEVNTLLNMFFTADRDRDSGVSPAEMRQVENALRRIYNVEVNVSLMDTDGNGSVSVDEFVAFMQKKMRQKLAERGREATREGSRTMHFA